MKRLFVTLLCLLSLSIAHAQDDSPQYRLRVPTADEYLNGILEVVPEPAEAFDYAYYQLYNTINNMLFLRYPDLYEADYETLSAVYQRLGIVSGYFSNRDTWNETIIHVWLLQNDVDLNTVTELQFADYDITVIPRDFDADGTNEYLLDVVKGANEPIDRLYCNYHAEYVDYLVVQQNGSEYNFVDTPFYWNGGRGPGPSRIGQGGIVETQFADINDDGLPEWVLIDGGFVGGGPGMGYVSTGSLFVLGWRDGGLVDLMPQLDWERFNIDEVPRYYEEAGVGCATLSDTVTRNISNTDNDSALEIEQQQVFVDNWYCEVYEIKSFDWGSSDDRYLFTGLSREYGETQNCAQRQAEEAMWTGDYETALTFYEQALTLERYMLTLPEDISDEGVEQALDWLQPRLDQLNQYLRARLALAYILTGRSEEADTLLHQLDADEILSEPIAYFINTLASHTDNPQQACISAYEVFTTHYPDQFYGMTQEQDVPMERRYYPENIGCDAPTLINDLLAKTTFTTDQSPVRQLSSLGLQVRQTLATDLNGDGHNEWLIWLNTPVLPIFFAPDGDLYHVSRPTVDAYLRSDGVQTWRLPEDSGDALVYLSDAYFGESPPWFGVYDPFAGGMGGGGTSCLTNGFTYLRMWRMEENDLIQIFPYGLSLCHDTLEQIFPEGQGSTILDGGTLREDNGYTPAFEYSLIYVWDNAAHTYIVLGDPNATPTSTPMPTPSPTPEPLYRSAFEALEAQDYVVFLEMTNVLSEYCADDINCLASTRYQRAFAFEMSGDFDEALTTYIAIYTAAPDSAWGQLAALHLEPIE